jgi:group I intron endonuclease
LNKKESIVHIGVYKITFPNGEFYIGSAYGEEGFEGRWNKHRKGDINSPKYLQELAQKYGGWSCVVFIILRETKTPSRALLCEQAYINRSKNNSLLLNKNLTVMKAPDMNGENNPMFGLRGENNPNFGKKRSEETRKKISEALIGKMAGENNPNFGKHLSEETRQRISNEKIGEKSPTVKLTWELVGEIRKKYKTKNYKQEQLADEYKVSKGCIEGIINNRTWKDDNYSHKRFFCSKGKGENNNQAKLTWIQVREIREKYEIKNENGKRKYSQQKLANEYNIGESTISTIILNESWVEKPSAPEPSPILKESINESKTI